MRRVTINERDVTVADNQTIVTDVVYVPGFSTQEVSGPVYCATLEDFRSTFGTDAPYFSQAQNYPSAGTFVEFNNTAAYSVGDLVTFESKIYACIEAVSQPAEGETNTNPDEDTTHWQVSSADGFPEKAIPDATAVSDSVMIASGEFDPGYVFATELLSAGLPVVYQSVGTTPSIDTMYEALAGDIFDPSTSPLLDKNGISVKYLTSGGYPTFEYSVSGSPSIIATRMQTLAANRGDCIAFIDHTDNPNRPLFGETSVYGIDGENIKTLNTDSVGSFSAMITPWVSISYQGSYTNATAVSQGITGLHTPDTMPGSFAYLMALASSLKTNASWLAIAGVARGRVPRLNSVSSDMIMTNTIAENMTNLEDAVAINPITNIRPYGQCIWGNRTLLDTSVGSGYATTFLNIRNLVCDVKKQAYIAAMSCIFEQNTDVLWINFKSMIQPMLEQMRTGGGLKNYKIIKLPGSERETIRAKIVLVPVYAVERFVIDVFITDGEINLGETSDEA